jgi:hypothetical protein
MLYFGGIDVTEAASRTSSAQQLSVALQEPFLFGDSLRNNILFGADLDQRRCTTDVASSRTHEVTESSRLAQDLEDFDEGTRPGRRRTRRHALGRPEAARVARARARSATVRCSSSTTRSRAVDHETEKRILKQPRPSTPSGARRSSSRIDSRPCVTPTSSSSSENGELVESGTHDELRRRRRLVCPDVATSSRRSGRCERVVRGRRTADPPLPRPRAQPAPLGLPAPASRCVRAGSATAARDPGPRSVRALDRPRGHRRPRDAAPCSRHE